jgi:phenylalanyl-tRNA synthetase beta chain
LWAIIKEKGIKQFREYEKYPPVIRDLAFVVNEKVLYNDIRTEIVNYHDFIKKVELFDVYQGKKLGRGKKNLAFHIIYQTDKTLTSEEIDKLQQGLVKKLEKKFEAKIRDF